MTSLTRNLEVAVLEELQEVSLARNVCVSMGEDLEGVETVTVLMNYLVARHFG